MSRIPTPTLREFASSQRRAVGVPGRREHRGQPSSVWTGATGLLLHRSIASRNACYRCCSHARMPRCLCMLRAVGRGMPRAWNPAEDATLRTLLASYGTQWQTIAAHWPRKKAGHRRRSASEMRLRHARLRSAPHAGTHDGSQIAHAFRGGKKLIPSGEWRDGRRPSTGSAPDVAGGGG